MNIAVACCIEKDYPGEERTIPGKKRLSRGRKDYPGEEKTIPGQQRLSNRSTTITFSQ